MADDKRAVIMTCVFCNGGGRIRDWVNYPKTKVCPECEGEGSIVLGNDPGLIQRAKASLRKRKKYRYGGEWEWDE